MSRAPRTRSAQIEAFGVLLDHPDGVTRGEQRMADVFRVHDSTTNGSPVASTSYATLDDDETNGGGGAGPSLAQLLQETVRDGARRGGTRASSSTAGTTRRASRTNSDTALPSLPSLSSPSSRAYISSLLSKDLAALLKEPEELDKQSELLDGDLATLCYKSIGDLLGVGECVDSVEDGFGRMQEALDSLLTCTEQLSSSCTNFTSSITPILSSRARLNLVRNNVTSIEDILSIPRLVSTCIRGGWWSEAVDLAFRARELEDILKGPTTSKDTGKSKRSLLGKVREDVEDELEALRSRIIEGLRGRGLKLPSAVRSIALLRRLSAAGKNPPKGKARSTSTSALSEPELRLTFLASRWDCLRSQLEQLEMSASSASSGDDRLRSLKRWIEVWREIIGETVNIYSEIFLTSPETPTPPSTKLQGDQKSLPSSGQSRDSALALSEASPPLALFLYQAQNALKSLLQTQLPNITSVSSLVSLQTQLSYCSAAFSKFGFDFRHIPNRSIASRVLELTSERFKTAVEAFRKDLSRGLTQSGARSGKPRLVISALVATEAWDSIAALDDENLTLSSTSRSSHPPAYIALFPPLAKLINNYASALNELRLLPITSLYPTVVRDLRASCAEASSSLLQFTQTALDSQRMYPDEDGQGEAEEQTMIIRRTSIIFTKCVVPWVLWALDDIVYPDLDKARWRDNDLEFHDSLTTLLQAVGICATPVSNGEPSKSSNGETTEAIGAGSGESATSSSPPHVTDEGSETAAMQELEGDAESAAAILDATAIADGAAADNVETAPVATAEDETP